MTGPKKVSSERSSLLGQFFQTLAVCREPLKAEYTELTSIKQILID